MRLHIVPFLRRWQDEAGDVTDFGYGPAVAVDLPGFIGVEVDQAVVGAWVGALRCTRGPDGNRAVGVTQVGGRMAAEAAAFHFFEFVGGHLEPAGRRQEVEKVEHHRGGIAYAGQQRAAFAVAVAYPDGHDIVGRDAYAPGVAVAVARTGLPGDLPCGIEGMPVALFLRPVHFRQGIEGTPRGATRDRRGFPPLACAFPKLTRQEGIGAGQVGQLDLGAAEDERKAVGVGAAGDGREAQALQEVDEFLDAVFVQHSDRRDVEGTADDVAGWDRSVEGVVEVAGREVFIVEWNVGDEHLGQDLPLVEHRPVEQGLECAAAAARRLHHVDVVAVGAAVMSHIADIGQGRAAADV